MRFLADLHISPDTVGFRRQLGHDAVRVTDRLSASASDEAIISLAAEEQRCVLTQDLDFSALMALSGRTAPSIITLRLASARVDYVNDVLERALPQCAADVTAGSLITIEDHGIRCRSLPLS